MSPAARIGLSVALSMIVGQLVVRRMLRRAAPTESKSTGPVVLRFGAVVWWVGLATGVGIPLAFTALALQPQRSPRPIDLYSCLAAAVLFGGAGWYLLLESTCTKVVFDDLDVTSTSLFQSPRSIRWHEITTVRFSRMLGYVVLDNGHDPPLRITAALAGFGSLIDALRAHVDERLLREPLQDLAAYHAKFGVR